MTQIIINEDGVELLRTSGSVSATTQHDGHQVLQSVFGDTAYATLDSGFLPPGVLSIRRSGGHEQFVVQRQPGIYPIIWGEHEGSYDAKTYGLAMPYQVVIGDFIDGNFLGARMFYSPKAVMFPDDQLYHANVPNLNCRGYGSYSKFVSVGWLCLYHTANTINMNMAQKINYMISRIGGGEAYNDRNMIETDGTRFYRDYQQKYPFLSSPKAWEEKTDQEGFLWTMNQDLWLPVKVQSPDDQSKHVDNGLHLTLGMAMYNNYKAYYTDAHLDKPINQIYRGTPEPFTSVLDRLSISISSRVPGKIVKK